MNTEPNQAAITYDKWGRMQYHPDFHGKHGTPWLMEDQTFLIENYEELGAEQVSFALERTIHTIMTRVYELRKEGLMAKPTKRAHHRRMRVKDTIQ
ncbi:hypothetical protein C1N32_20790 [Vibrio diazotrophicus]|uniref:Uncharacterized protein n=1 Tax=Vibrio diazotrophicus TaxID=685 RepID=A0A2J8HSE4_VIBDI|nr:hypothetical protein [Vibrio diazotrophicus]PNI01202.1 hypothetical protein C1N32_20790 [Vibrio diazotrophicus]